MVRLTIDGREIEVPEGTRLFDACTEARGEPLPHFCYHPDLSIAGVCRLCQVEVEGMPKLTIACNTGVREGMVVHTKSERVQRAAKQILEMHLINHPVDCPICDQAGECGLQDQYMQFGLYESEVEMEDKVHKDKVQIIGPQVILDKERCVLCSRCVRFCEEVTGTRELGIFQRGDRAEIGVSPGRELDNNYSLNTVDICPVGALTSRDFRFKQRVWLLKGTPSICPGCATGCNVRLDHNRGRVYRLKPRRNDEVNGPWMCDLGRMIYKTIHDEARLETPLLRENGELRPVSWERARDSLVELLRPGQVGLALASAQQSLEELVLFRMLVTTIADWESLVGGVAEEGRAEGDGLLLSADRTPNRHSLQWLGLGELPAAEIASRFPFAGRTVVVYGADPASNPALEAEMAGCERLVYFGTHETATARAASLVLPMSTWAEKDGLFVNGKGRIQQFHRAIAPPGEAKEDWRLLADLVDVLGKADVPRDLPHDLRSLRLLVRSELELPNGTDLNDLPALGVSPEFGVPEPAGGES